MVLCEFAFAFIYVQISVSWLFQWPQEGFTPSKPIVSGTPGPSVNLNKISFLTLFHGQNIIFQQLGTETQKCFDSAL